MQEKLPAVDQTEKETLSSSSPDTGNGTLNADAIPSLNGGYGALIADVIL